VWQPAQSEQVFYYHLDAVGSVRAITDSAGQVVERHDYLPFGEAPPGEPAGQDARRVAGKERDSDTGFDYFGGRYYANGTGRFTTVDPGHVNGDIYDPQSWNAYAYARNNPLKYTDPTGTTYEICPTDEKGNPINCTSVSDQEFSRVARNPGAGLRLSDGRILTGDRVAAYYRQTTIDTVDAMVNGAGRLADIGVNTALVVTSPSLLLAGGLTVGGAAAGTEIITIAGEAGFDLMGNQALNQAIGASQRGLLRMLFKEGRLSPELSRRALELYREVAKRAIAEGKDGLGEQARRLRLIEEVLKRVR
jgi:RHS repeat-associated protein